MDEVNNKEFGRFLAKIRSEKKMTQKELAKKLFVTDKAVSKWECGHSLPDVSLLLPLSVLLGVSVTELLMAEKTSEDTPFGANQTEGLLLRILSFPKKNLFSNLFLQKESLNKTINKTLVLCAISLVSYIVIFIYCKGITSGFLSAIPAHMVGVLASAIAVFSILLNLFLCFLVLFFAHKKSIFYLASLLQFAASIIFSAVFLSSQGVLVSLDVFMSRLYFQMILYFAVCVAAFCAGIFVFNKYKKSSAQNFF